MIKICKINLVLCGEQRNKFSLFIIQVAGKVPVISLASFWEEPIARWETLFLVTGKRIQKHNMSQRYREIAALALGLEYGTLHSSLSFVCNKGSSILFMPFQHCRDTYPTNSISSTAALSAHSTWIQSTKLLPYNQCLPAPCTATISINVIFSNNSFILRLFRVFCASSYHWQFFALTLRIASQI